MDSMRKDKTDEDRIARAVIAVSKKVGVSPSNGPQNSDQWLS
jgi:hypothetical protein